MRRNFFVGIVSIGVLLSNCMNTNAMEHLTKWKKAVIHIECATDSKSFEERRSQWNERRDNVEKLNKGEITIDEFLNLQSALDGSRDIRFLGTAIFFTHQSGRYLLTARHVLHDPISAKREIEREEKRLADTPDGYRESRLKDARESAKDCIVSIIFRVPSLDECLQDFKPDEQEFLMNVRAKQAFTFSDPTIDLAIISLDPSYATLADDLLSRGFKPISMNDIADKPSGEGVEVFTVGYPQAPATIGKRKLPAETQHWSSSYFSVPTFTFGRVSMVHNSLPFSGVI